MKTKNILELTLELFKVKYTDLYTSKLYNEHPYRNSLFGLSEMLSNYNIENEGLKIKNRDELSLLQTPFVAKLEKELVIILKLTDTEVFLIWEGREISIPINEFISIWDGNILWIKATENSIEPQYKEHRMTALLIDTPKWILTTAFGIIFLISFFINNIYSYWGMSSLLAINLVGTYIGYLLLLKQSNIQNKLTTKICSLSKKSNCDSVLNSNAAKLFGIIGWSEIGFGYFISNIIILSLCPQLINYLALINICALPYTIWSIWYQKVKIKQWCPLCLIVQLLLWFIFIIDILFSNISLPQFSIIAILLTGCIYAVPFFTINILLRGLKDDENTQKLKGEINTLKMKDEVFGALLKEEAYYKTDHSTSQILWGNKDAKTLVTIITNPHCGPCSQMHKRIEKLLEKYGDELCIQYIFSSFSEDLDKSSIFLISIYLYSELSLEKKKKIYDEWFGWGRNNAEEFFTKYALSAEDIKVKAEYNKHKEFMKNAEINGTPTILFNGYELPEEYELEDIGYFIDSKI